MILKRFSLLLCFLTIFNCSSNDNKVDKSLTNNQETADLMYIDAMNKFNEKQLDEAIIIFSELILFLVELLEQLIKKGTKIQIIKNLKYIYLFFIYIE